MQDFGNSALQAAIGTLPRTPLTDAVAGSRQAILYARDVCSLEQRSCRHRDSLHVDYQKV